MCRGIPFQPEPLAATKTVYPALMVQAFHVIAVKQVVRPLGVAGLLRICRALDICLATELEFVLVA